MERVPIQNRYKKRCMIAGGKEDVNDKNNQIYKIDTFT